MCVGARWQAVVSVYCALPEGPRRAVHRACCAALAPGGLFLYQGFAPCRQPAAADAAVGDANYGAAAAGAARAAAADTHGPAVLECGPRPGGRPRSLAGPTDPALRAAPADLIEDLQGLDLEVAVPPFSLHDKTRANVQQQ